jgi:hypothetical protein
MELKRAIEIFEYNKEMLTCDMSISRNPEHQDISPDYYGKDAEDLYNAIVCVEKYIKNAIPVEWIEKYAKRFIELENRNYFAYRGFSDIGEAILNMLENWEKENEAN